jgi:hypothetical protein
MKKLLKKIGDDLLIPMFKHIVPLMFIGLLYTGYLCLQHLFFDDVIVSSKDSNGWITLRPNKVKMDKPSDYSLKTYDLRVVYFDGKSLIQVRKKQ